jgi:hypothetical protein
MALTDVLQNQEIVAVSTASQILVNGNLVGVIQNLSPSQDRASTAVRGIGIGDRIIERVWQLTEYKLSIEKMALFQKKMINLFGYGDTFRMLAQLRVPIDIQEILLLPDGTNVRTTVYRGCYMTSYSDPKQISGEIIITETAQFDCTSVDDGSNSPFDYDVGINPPANS